MKKMNRLTYEALRILKAIYEDQAEERFAYRNDIHRLMASGLSCSFGSLEHFLDRYGYVSIDQRHDALHLTSSGLEAVQGDDKRIKSLNDDIQYHFAKEIAEGILKETISINTGKRFDQHYIRFEGIGRGGVGSVWRAEHLKTGRSVAIKTLEGIDEVITSGRKSTLKKRLERKIRQLAQLSHPFICPILDLSVHHTPPYYVMPLYSGGSLRDVLVNGPMQPEVALNLFSQICMGLHHAHQKDVLHLDVKPENILLDERGNIRLFDFGMSRTVAKQVSQVGRQSYIGFGSVAYMAPELLRDPQAEAASIDIYALGLILYEMLVGDLPGRRSPMPSEVIEGLPQPIDDLFDAMTQDSVSKRPSSMQQVLDTLNQVPPFDRLASQSMVMTFIESPFKLPGLHQLDIPEFEESIDIHKNRSTAKSEFRLETSRHAQVNVALQDPNPSENPVIVEESSSQKDNGESIEYIKTNPAKEHTEEEYNTSKQSELDNMQTTESAGPSPLSNEIKSHFSVDEKHEDLDPSGIQVATPMVEISDVSELDDNIMEDSLEVIEELEEIEDIQSIIASSTHQSSDNKIESNQTIDNPNDDFADDEATALHEQPVSEGKPHLSQPQRTPPRRTSSVAQQLFERHNKDNRFKS